jgi:hypothetical protein
MVTKKQAPFIGLGPFYFAWAGKGRCQILGVRLKLPPDRLLVQIWCNVRKNRQQPAKDGNR